MTSGGISAKREKRQYMGEAYEIAVTILLYGERGEDP